jgi:hypothetical protein
VATNFASALRRGGFFISEKTMEYEIDMDAVDHVVVGMVILLVCEAMLAAKDVDPTADECIVAFGKIIQMVLDDAENMPMVH